MTGYAEQARQEKRDAAERAGIDDALISRLVDQFYARVREHPDLGPIFDGHVRDWGTHLARMKDFWGSIAIESGRYHGNPMQKHAVIPELRSGHFAQWLVLWRETVTQLAPTDAARAFFITRAGRIGESLQMGIALHRKPGDVRAGLEE